MEKAYAINCAGLIFDIVGVLGLFKYGLPEDITGGGSVFVSEETDLEEIRRTKDKYNLYSKISLSLIILGFLSQLLSNLMFMFRA